MGIKQTHSNKDAEAALEAATLQLFDSLKWETLYAEKEKDGDQRLLGRAHQGEVVLHRYLLPALEKLNPDLPHDALQAAVEILTHDRSAMSLAHANHDVFQLLKEGIRINYRDESGEELTERVKVIDWQQPENNHFLMVSQLWVNGDPYRKRADLVGFVNGLPLVFIELKAPDQNVYQAFQDNFRDYKNTIPQLFWYNAVVVLSNGSNAKIGSLTAPWEHFADWKKINDEEEAGIISLETLIRGTCEKSRLLDIAENFSVFQDASGGLVKLVSKNHQYLGVNNAIRAVQELGENQGRLGVFWHTQGSGKSASMIFFTQKVLRKIPGNWTFVIITDRVELDNQIYKTFAASHIITEGEIQADSAADLRKLLREDHRYVFTLIHKFRTENGARHPVLSDRSNIIVITDEAHRSQYDVLAQNMRDALPNAAFLGFTGTPLIKGEAEKTRQVFGDYVSIYNFAQSIADGATVPLYYENRIPEVQLINENLNDDMAALLDAAMLDEAQEKKLEREFSQQYHIITREDRLEKIAEDIVAHFLGRGHRGKAMVVCIDKVTAVKMYDKVQHYWQSALAELKQQSERLDGEDLARVLAEIAYLEQTDMAVVVSSGQNEVEDMANKGVDILTHRRRMAQDDLETKFKDSDDPFRIVFVCAMWMTGFDVPSCSTIYLDKPMRNHTLMQTIARANRVYRDKTSGLIVDYIGIFRDLEKALAIYGAPGATPTDFPVKDKAELLWKLRTAVAEAEVFLNGCGIDFKAILNTNDIFLRTRLKEDAVEAILAAGEDAKKRFLQMADILGKLYKAYLPDPIDEKHKSRIYLVTKLANRLRSLQPKPDISAVMDQVEVLLDASIEGYRIEEPVDEYAAKLYDLSQIDFDKLRERFEKGRQRIIIEQLKGAIEEKLASLIQVNSSRMDFLERFQALIDEYNSGSGNLEEIFEKLKNFSHNLTDEEQRYIREELNSEEELAVFDILTRPDMKLTKSEKLLVKRIARELLEILRTEKLVLDWRKKQAARADVQVTIKDFLDQLPPTYSVEIYNAKCSQVYQYIYEQG